MMRNIFAIVTVTIFLSINTTNVFATTCIITPDKPNGICTDPEPICRPSKNDPTIGTCEKATAQDIFGKIQPPAAIKNFLGQDPTGAGGISKFLSNFIILIYTVAAIVLVLMLLWGAFDWMISEGNKEKLQAAQSKIIAAVVGLLLFAVAFAVIAVLGQFTGFTFFSGQ